MAKIVPFRGILYNVARVSMDDVLAPPYDVITPEYREALYMQSPYNIVRIDFGKEKPEDSETENKYTRAREYLDAWEKEGVFIRSEKPSFYAYEMSYMIHSVQKRLIGLLALVKLEELGKGNIYPHECTHAKPKQDRLNLMRACEANTSPIFSLYKSSERNIADILSEVAKTTPYIESNDISGDIHRLWQIDDAGTIETITKELEDKAVFIADGHHRYETAYEYYREMTKKGSPAGERSFDHVLMFLANMLDEGISILPTHRLLKEIHEDMEKLLSEYFEIEPVQGNFNIAEVLSGKRRVFGLYRGGNRVWHILKYKGGNLSDTPHELRDVDVIILHELLLKKLLQTADIGYEMNIEKVLEKVNNGEFRAAFFLNPTRVEDVEKSALSLVRMPPKSTYFYPKLLTGLVINRWQV
ncbi:MAG: DUF1015 domain-containing protein [Nitrospirota bacterium]